MSKITIIVPDRVVLVDGLAYEIPGDKWPGHDSALHAIQYSDGVAECQYNNERITGDQAQSIIAPFLKVWAEANAARTHAVSPEAAAAAHEASLANAPASGTDPV